ncbi:hypothetical protein [Dishui Lake phycodnavirus 4]|nr:hypothetical protein [Dishui Lake phycodnavirus 4]
MKLASIIVTRSKSCHVKTLHTILRLNIRCLENRWEHKIHFVNDDPFQKAEMIEGCMKDYDRIVFIDFGIQMDDESIQHIFNDMEGSGVLVYPGVTEGIDWDMFKDKVRNDSSEPIAQMGLYFDTDVYKEISNDIYSVKTTRARCWVMNTKNVAKAIKDKKTGKYKIYAKMETMFDKFKQDGVKINAFVGAKLTATYNHECIANILHTAGVQAT